MSASNPLLDPAWVAAQGGPPSRRRRWRLALAVTAAVLLVAGVAAVVVWRFLELTDSRTATSLVVGECFELPDGESVVLVTIQECAGAHDAEIYAREIVRAPAFPGDRALTRRADRYCSSELREFLGGLRGEKVSGLDIWYAVPSAESWEQDDLSITCALYDREGPTVGTLEGAGARVLEQNENVF